MRGRSFLHKRGLCGASDLSGVKVVQERLGHTSAAMTLDIYSHLWPADDDRTRSAVEAALGALADISRTTESAQAI